MTKKQLETLAAKLWLAYLTGRDCKVYSTYHDLNAAQRAPWLAVAKVARQELTNNPKPIRRRVAKPKACKLNAHGKWECPK
jgi:hypothetical protein